MNLTIFLPFELWELFLFNNQNQYDKPSTFHNYVLREFVTIQIM
tara:strand:+ start:874 stop:1005 length:132 start_codon:yes stop_codon:yes gene_type:complete